MIGTPESTFVSPDPSEMVPHDGGACLLRAGGTSNANLDVKLSTGGSRGSLEP